MKKEWIELYNDTTLIAKQIFGNEIELVNNSVELPFGLFKENKIGEVISVFYFNTWLKERIFPKERMGADELLKEAGMTDYKEWELIRLTNGRLFQDNFNVKWVRG